MEHLEDSLEKARTVVPALEKLLNTNEKLSKINGQPISIKEKEMMVDGRMQKVFVLDRPKKPNVTTQWSALESVLQKTIRQEAGEYYLTDLKKDDDGKAHVILTAEAVAKLAIYVDPIKQELTHKKWDKVSVQKRDDQATMRSVREQVAKDLSKKFNFDLEISHREISENTRQPRESYRIMQGLSADDAARIKANLESEIRKDPRYAAMVKPGNTVEDNTGDNFVNVTARLETTIVNGKPVERENYGVSLSSYFVNDIAAGKTLREVPPVIAQGAEGATQAAAQLAQQAGENAYKAISSVVKEQAAAATANFQALKGSLAGQVDVALLNLNKLMPPTGPVPLDSSQGKHER